MHAKVLEGEPMGAVSASPHLVVTAPDLRTTDALLLASALARNQHVVVLDLRGASLDTDSLQVLLLDFLSDSGAFDV